MQKKVDFFLNTGFETYIGAHDFLGGLRVVVRFLIKSITSTEFKFLL